MFENTLFYAKAKKMLDDYVAAGGDVQNLSKDDQTYKYIKNLRVLDENGKMLTLEEKFEKLKHPRQKKYVSDVRQALIDQIEQYLNAGGSFHIARKKLPFYERLTTYSRSLERRGVIKTHEQIMKDDLGYLNYSDDYFRCKDLVMLQNYRDVEGYIDDYRQNKKLKTYVKDIALTYGMPYYMVVTLLCDEKQRSYKIEVDKVHYTEMLLKNHAQQYGTFVGIKRDHPQVYNAFEYLTRYYSDGSEMRFSKQEWLDMFGLGNVEHRFKDSTTKDVDLTEAVENIKRQCPNGVVIAKDVNSADYAKFIKRAFQLGISVSELFSMYGLKHKHLESLRMARTTVKEIPYMAEMKERRDELIRKFGKTQEQGCCKEEIFEAKLKAVKQVYAEFKEKLENYLPTTIVDEITDEATENI